MPRRASLLFINQHYWPDHAATGQNLTDLCEHLAAEGHDVHVLCSRGKYLSGAMDVPKREVRNGVAIRRVDATSFGRATHAGRLADYASFYAKAFWHAWRDGPFGCVVTLTTPPLLCAGAWALKKAAGQRYGVWSMDLHPDAEVALGMLDAGGPLARALHALNDAGYRGADFVVDLGFRMKERLLAKGVAEERLHTIPVWSKKDEIRPVPPEENPLRAELGLEGKFVVMYSGNAGLAHRFGEVLQAMRRLKEHPEIYFLFVGGGPRREEIAAFAERQSIPNFQYLDYFPREQLASSLSLGDVHLLTLRSDMAGIAVPGKLYGIMAAGRPVAMVGPPRSEPGRAIRAHRIGRVVDPAHPGAADGFHDALLALYEAAEQRRAMGRRARCVFLETYEQQVACRQWAALVAGELATTDGSPKGPPLAK